MRYSGVFAEAITPANVTELSVSFLADDLQVRRGGVAANIAFGMSALGKSAVVLAAVGHDSAPYEEEYRQAAPLADLSYLRRDDSQHSARFTCTTDRDQAQIASFFPGAMSAAADQSVLTVHAEEPVDLVMVSPNDPDAMKRHTQECRDENIDFVADPSQQVTFLGPDDLRFLIDGAKYLCTNEHEARVIMQRTGLSDVDILERVDVQVTTLGAKGVRIRRLNESELFVPALAVDDVVDPTGAGDAFRAGFFTAIAHGSDLERAAQIGSTLSAFAIEVLGPQGYKVSSDVFVARVEQTYGTDAAKFAQSLWA